VLAAVRSWATRLAVALGVVGLLVGAAAGLLLARRRSV
jgi:uncharacterized protein YneF (UPF0154 family)